MPFTELREGVCSGCGAPILWAMTADTTKRIPLDAKPVKHVYRVQSAGIVERAEVYQSHFITCPKRDEFSKAKRP